MNTVLEKDFRTYSQDEMLVEKRREQIVLSASTLFIKKGFDRTNMKELSDAFGLSKGGIYHYIGSKEDILFLIIKYNSEKQEQFIEKLNESVSGLSPVESLKIAINSHLDRIDKYQDMYNFLNHVMPHLEKEERQVMYSDSEKLVQYFMHFLELGTATGDFRVKDRWFYAWDIMHICHRWAFYRWTLRKRYTLEEYKLLVIDHVLNPILTNHGYSIAGNEAY